MYFYSYVVTALWNMCTEEELLLYTVTVLFYKNDFDATFESGK